MIENVLPFYCFIIILYLVSLRDIYPIRENVEEYNNLLVFTIVLLFIFAGGRWSNLKAGYDITIFDYDTYQTIYNNSLRISNFISDYFNSILLEIKSTEIGYIFYSSFCNKILNFDYNIYLLFTNILLVLFLFKSLKRNGINKGYLFILFYYAARLYLQYNFILMRQAIALVIVWCGFKYLLLNKNKIFYIYVAFAMAFHTSAIIAIIFPFTLKLNISRKLYVIISLLLFASNILHLTDGVLLLIAENFFNIIGGGTGEKLAKYISEDSEYRGLNLLSFVELIPFIYVSYKYYADIIKTKIGFFYYRMFYLFLFLLIVTMNFGFLTRMCQYFMYSIFYFLFFIIDNSKIRHRNLLIKGLGIYLLLYSFRYINFWFYETPYSFFLFN